MTNYVLKEGVKLNIPSDVNRVVLSADALPFLAKNSNRKQLFDVMPNDVDNPIELTKEEKDIFILDNNDSNNKDVWVGKFSEKIPPLVMVDFLDQCDVTVQQPYSKAIIENAIRTVVDTVKFEGLVQDYTESLGVAPKS